MDCEDLSNPVLLPGVFNKMDESTLKMLLECLYKSHYKVFYRVGLKMCTGYSYPEYQREDIAHDAFTDAIIVLYNKLKRDGWQDKGVELGAAFMIFYKFTVRKLLKERGREEMHDRSYTKFETVTKITGTEANPGDKENDETLLSGKERILEEAFKELGERGTNLIKWRKNEKLSNEIIAERLHIQPRSVNNEVYDAMERLKKIVKRLKK